MEKEKNNGYWIDGPGIQVLAKLMPVENIKVYIRIYKGGQQWAKGADHSAMDRRDDHIKQAWKHFHKIKQGGWISEKDLAAFFEPLGRLLSLEKQNEQILAKSIKKDFKSKDPAFDFLIYALVYDVAKYKIVRKGLKGFKAISEFLCEQDIKKQGRESDPTEDSVRVQYRRINKEDVWYFLVLYQNHINKGLRFWGTPDAMTYYPGYLTDTFPILGEILSMQTGR